MMKHNAEKRYYECLAKLILETYLPDVYHGLEVSDCPDLRLGCDHGIEVTRVLYPNKAQISGIFHHIARKDIGTVDKRHLDTLKRLNAEIFSDDRGIVYGYSPGEAIWVNDDVLKKEFMKKTNKYQQYAANVSTVDLFMFSPLNNWFEETLIRGLMQWVVEENACCFENIFVFEYDYLYAFNAPTRAFRTIPVKAASRGSLVQLLEMAKAYSEKDE